MHKKLIKLVALLAAALMMLPLLAACGGGSGGTDTTTTAGTNTTTTEATTPAPTTTAEPTTEGPTAPPTEMPTDPASPSAEDELGIIPGMRYYLRSPNSNLYLTVDGDMQYAGFTQEEWAGTSNQMFAFEVVDAEAHTYKIRCIGTKEGYIDVADADPVDGALLELTSGSSPYSDVSQVWKLRHNSKGHYTLMSSVTNFKGCMDVNGVSKDPGAYVHQWTGGSAQNQVWFLELCKDTTQGYTTTEATTEEAAG